MFTYADLNKIGYDHFLFNTGYFTVLKEVFPNDDVEFYCENSHFNYIKESINLNGVKHYPVYVLPKKTGFFLFKWLYKIIFDFKIIFEILNSNKNQTGRFVFFATMPVRSMLFLLFWHKFFFHKTHILLTLHGEIELWFNTPKTFSQKIHCGIFKLLFKYRNERFHLFFPNKYIKNNVSKEPLLAHKKTMSIWNLLLNTQGTTIDFDKIILGHIGSTEIRKNSGMFFEFANKFFEQHQNLMSRVSFLVAGKYNTVFNNLYNDRATEIANQDKIMSLDYFNKSIQSLHFSVIFIREKEYIYRESATLLESIKFCKPIIGLKHPYFDYLESKYGAIGIFEPTIETLIARLAKMLETDFSKQYSILKGNIRLLQKKNSLEELAQDLKLQMKDANININ